ncbi:MAG: DUF2142 domain-containing protein [bacterium]
MKIIPLIKKHWYLVALITFFIVITSIINIFTPPWAFPDESAHFSYTEFIIEHHTLPSYLTSLDFWEAHQPPLYYSLGVLIKLPIQNLAVSLQLIVLRLFSTLLAVGTIMVSYLIGKKIFKNKYLILLVPTLVALLPMQIYIASSYNNDNLANLLGALLIYFFLIFWREKISQKNIIWFSVIVTASILTKVGLYPIVAIVFIFLIYKLIRQKNWRLLSIIIMVPLILSGWWFVRNYFVYGDLFGWSQTEKLWALQKQDIWQRDIFIRWWRTTYESFWGIFGGLNIAMQPWVYKILKIIGVLAFFGNLIFFWQKENSKNIKTKLIWLYGIFGITLLSVFVYSIKFYQPQGRYLFIALISAVIFLVVGLGMITKNKNYRMFVLILAILFFGNLSFTNTELLRDYNQKKYKPMTEYEITDKATFAVGEERFKKEGPATITIKDSENVLLETMFSNTRADTSKIKQVELEIESYSEIEAKLLYRNLVEKEFMLENSTDFTVKEGVNTYTLALPDNRGYPNITREFAIYLDGQIGQFNLNKFKLVFNEEVRSL